MLTSADFSLQGEWKPKKIDNPAFKGKWVHPEIDNPEYVEDKTLYKFDDNSVIGLDLWQVKHFREADFSSARVKKTKL